jgi:hypothetical protein
MAAPVVRSTRRSRLPVILAVLLVLAVLSVVLLFAVRAIAVGKGEEALASELGPAREWDLGVPLLAAPKALLGLPFDLVVRGEEVQLRGAPPLRQVKLDLLGVKVSPAGRKVTGVERAAIDATLGEAAVVEFIRQQALSAKIFQDVNAQLAPGEVHLTCSMDSEDLELPIPVPSFGTIQAAVTAVPEVRAPATIALNPTKITLRGFGQEMAVQPDWPGVRQLASADLSLDMRRLVKGLTVETATIVEHGLQVTGTIAPQAYLNPEQPPARPDATEAEPKSM